MTKIAVCSLYINEWYRYITKYGKKTLENYCTKHGYDFFFETEETVDGVYDKSRDIPWFKIQLILKIMRNHPEYDYIVWNDADSLIINDNIRFEDIINVYLPANYDMLLGPDQNTALHTSTMFVKNSSKCREILEKTWNNDSNFDVNFHEQASLSDLYTRNVDNCKDFIHVLPQYMQNMFNTYWSMFTVNCFIFHAARCAHDKKGFLYTIDLFCPIRMDEDTDETFEQRRKFITDQALITDILQKCLSGKIGRPFPSRRYIDLVNGKIVL